MCGIFGMDIRKANLTSEKRAMLAGILSVANDNRGGDSWGYWASSGKNPKVERGLGDIKEVALNLSKETFFLAHTRKKTTGAISKENAHPFEIGNIIGAHNGVITNHDELNKKYKRDFQVDSMQIFGHLNEGLDFKELRGYGAIEFIDKRHPDAVFLCKISHGGDLSIYGIGDGPNKCRGVIWSSDENHIRTALKVAKIKAFEFKVSAETLYYVKDGNVYTTNEKLELGSYPSYSGGRSNHSWHGMGGNRRYNTQTQQWEDTPESKKNGSASKPTSTQNSTSQSTSNGSEGTSNSEYKSLMNEAWESENKVLENQLQTMSECVAAKNWEKKYIDGAGFCWVNKISHKVLKIVNGKDGKAETVTAPV